MVARLNTARFPRLGGPAAMQLPQMLLEGALIGLLAWQCARLIWAVATPLGPVGNWKAALPTAAGDTALLSRFDPFFRLSPATGPATVTSLAIKLFGVRVDNATGRGSAIIAGPDGIQQSYAVGDEIAPGVRLKSVQFDGITIDRGGAAEQVFLDQSVAAPVAAPPMPGVPPAAIPSTPPVAVPPPPQAVAPGAGADRAAALAAGVSMAPRTEKGEVTGMTVSPRGDGAMFNTIGLKPGDVVTQINGTRIHSSGDIATALWQTPASGVATITVERGGNRVTLPAKVKP